MCIGNQYIIAESFQLSEQMHRVRYLWLIGDGDSSVYDAVVTGVPSQLWSSCEECRVH